jgi:RecG-like helicase
MTLIGVTPTRIADVQWRQAVCVSGRVRSIRVQPRADVPTLECVLDDGTGGLSVVFLGRRHVAGIHLGTVLCVSGRVGAHHGRLAILNPDYEFLFPTTSSHGPH